MFEKPNVLKVIRISMFKNQQDAANAIGVSRAWYALIEQGNLTPSKDVSEKLENVFNLSISELLKEVSVEELTKAGA
jgi:DNA-binding XRE family transcriptional regulator